MTKAITKSTDSKDALGTLPSWDLSALYDSITAPAIAEDIKEVDQLVSAFAKQYKGKLAKLSAEQLAEAISEYEAIQEIFGRLGTYSQLIYAADMADEADTRFYQDISEKLNDISTPLLFFTLELNVMEQKTLDAHIKTSKKLAHYAPWIRDIRVFAEYQLEESLEQLLHEKSITGRQAWNRLFDETLADLRFDFRGEEKSCAEILNLLSSHKPDERKDAAKALGKTLGDNIKTFSFIMNVLAKDKSIEDKMRSYPAPISYRNRVNYIEDAVVEALISAVKASYPRLSHRYYKLKAKWFGVDALPYWDRNAPLPSEDHRLIPWTEARDTVISAYAEFSPTLSNLGKQFFDKNWIDAPTRKGKDSGAFSHPAVPSAHPFILMNYQGKTRDVMTLAHELGHGVHQCLSASQGALMADTPLTLAETASVFGEQLTFRKLLSHEKDPKQKKIMIAGKVEDMLNTVVRQIAFCDFETQVHAKRKEGELSVDDIGKIWMKVQSESLGSGIRLEPEYQNFWAYISHFIHSPFYVYSYAFGDCLVNTLYATYQKHPKGFEEKYLTMLKAGGTLWHKELLAPFGLDATDPAFWQQGLDVISGFIDELESHA
jgi:oligoendopeptidase F